MYDLELERVAATIIERKSKLVLIQLPDGIKQRAGEIVDTLQQKTGATIIIWFSSCFGQCDYPLGLGPLGIDLFIQYGHNRYHKTQGEW